MYNARSALQFLNILKPICYEGPEAPNADSERQPIFNPKILFKSDYSIGCFGSVLHFLLSQIPLWPY